MRKIAILIIISLIAFTSCKEKNKSALLPNVTGKAGEVVLVIDNDLWNSEVGKEFRKKLIRDYPGLPQPEPLFDLIHIPYQAFTSIFKTHRNVIIVQISNEYSEPKIIIQKNLYAKPQIVINVIGPDISTIENLIAEKGELIVDRLLKMETSRYANNYIKYEEKEVGERIAQKFGINLKFPKGYKIDMDTTDFVWIANDSPTMAQAVLIYSFNLPEVDLTTPYLVAKRNEFTKRFVAGPNTNSYMIVEQEMEPFRREIEVNNLKITELRGLWRVEGDFMGGPFISFTFINHNKVIHIDGFVYAPQFKKRDYIRQLEAILNSVKTN